MSNSNKNYDTIKIVITIITFIISMAFTKSGFKVITNFLSKLTAEEDSKLVDKKSEL